MSEPVRVRGRRALTPAVVAAVVFLAVCALTSVSFVVARGGLELPTASTGASAIAEAPSPTPAPDGETLGPSPVASSGAGSPATSAPTSLEPSGTPTPSPTPASESPGPGATPPGTPDPLLALARCPGHPGCYLYTVRRGDTLTEVNDRFGLLLWITRALNPEVGSGEVIVVGQTLYLGRDPEARLDACPDGAPCRLYVVRSGDTLSAIADRFHLSEAAILGLNPGLAPNAIVTGEVVRLPLFG